MVANQLTVSSTVLRAGLVGWILRQPTICIHADEVKGTVEPTRKVRQIHIESELLVTVELEHLVCGVRGHQVSARADVGRVRSLGDELQLQRVAAGCNPVCAGVIGTVNGAVGSTRLVIGARRSVPRVTGITVGGSEGS